RTHRSAHRRSIGSFIPWRFRTHPTPFFRRLSAMTTRSVSSGSSTVNGPATALRGETIQPPRAMKIVDVRSVIVGTPWRELTFVELVTDSGLSGVSEARMVNKTTTLLARIEELAPRYVLGSDPFDLERLTWNILRAEYARPEEITQSALAA